MRALVFALLAAGSLSAQGLQFFIDSTNAPLSSTTPYQFPSTPAGSSSSITVRITNPSTTTPVQIISVFLGASSTSSSGAPGFSLTSAPQGQTTIAPGTSIRFNLSFTPSSAGTVSGYLLLQYRQNGAYTIISQLQGTGTPSALELTCQDPNAVMCDGKTVLQPNTSVPINFGPLCADPAGNTCASGSVGVPIGSSYTITFTFSNSSSTAVSPPAISLQNAYPNTAFSLDKSDLPASIGPNSTGSFTVTFAPQPTGNLFKATLLVGDSPSAYPLDGLVAGSPPMVKCTDATGGPCAISGNTVTLGPLPTSFNLTFQVINPSPLNTQYADIVLPAPPSIAGQGFAMNSPTLALSTTTAPGTAIQSGQPVTIQPGWTLTFQITFNGVQPQAGTLTLPGLLTYTLNAQPFPPLGSSQSDLPGIAVVCGSSPCSTQTLTSQQQVHATLQLSTPSTGSATLALIFAPSVMGITRDPAVMFVSPVNQSQIGPISFLPGSLTGTLSGGQSQFTFQTGTTAGALTFTVTDQVTLQTLALPPITIAPALTQITSITAARQAPNLVVTITGYDNTYSAGQLSFVFATSAGSLSVPVDATAAFHNYFFTNNTAGGAFSLQASFPVSNGDVTQISSVSATITNSAGPTSTTQVFQ